MGALPQMEGLHAGGGGSLSAGLPRRRRQGPALLPDERRQRRDGGHRPGTGSRPARHGDRNGQDLRRLPDHLAPVEGAPQEARPVPGGSQRADRPGQKQRLQALRRRHDQAVAPRYGSFLRNLPQPLSVDHRAGGEGQELPRVHARVFRPHRHRRVPSRKRGGGFRVEGDSGVFLRRDADRPHGHAEGDELRLQHRLFRRTRLFLLPQAGDPGRLSRPLQGRAGTHRPRRGGLPPRARAARPRREGSRGSHLQREGFRPRHRAGRAREGRRPQGLAVPAGKRRPLSENDPLLRGQGARGADAPGARQRERRPRGEEPPLRHAHHRRRRGRGEGTRQLHRPRIEISRPRRHVAAALHGRGRENLPAHRPGSRGRLHDRVQADRRARHPRARGREEILLHAHGFPRRDPPLRGSGLRRGAGPDLRTRRGRPHGSAGRRRAAGVGRRRDHRPSAAPARSPAQRRPEGENLRGRRGGEDHRRAGPVSRRERQAHHGIPARLHPKSSQEALRRPGRFSEALEGGGAQGGRRRGTRKRGAPVRPAGRGGGQEPRPLRSHLPRGLRRQAAHPPRT